MQINFFSGFAKKENSTKVPLITDATKTLTGYLIEPCSIMNPTFQIERFASDASPQSYTYAYIGEFARYYFVDDWSWSDGLWLCKLRVDVLGSFKTQIGNSSEYVVRADTTTDFNGAITDMMYPCTTNFNIEKVPMSNPFVQSLSQGTYILGIINNSQSGDSVGAITYYAMTAQEFADFKHFLLTDANLMKMDILDQYGNLNISDCSAELFRALYNPYQYIASCMWFPILKTSLPGNTVSTIPLGWWDYNFSAKLLSDQTGVFNDGAEQVPVHPLAATRGKYLNYAPFTRITLFGKFGTLPLDPSYLEIGSYIRNYYTVDYITGECIFEVYVSPTAAASPDQVHIAKTSFMIGVPIQLAQVAADYLGATVSAINTVNNTVNSTVSGLFRGGVAGAMTGFASAGATGIYDTINAAMPQLITNGSNGSFCVADKSTVMVVLQYIPVEENITHKGRPVCSTKVLNTLSGYIQCAEPDIDISCFDAERIAIGNYLVSGFYLE